MEATFIVSEAKLKWHEKKIYRKQLQIFISSSFPFQLMSTDWLHET